MPMDTAARREQLKEALVDAAVARHRRRSGLAELKARALADEAGCAVGAIYNVVADLDELVLLANTRTLAALEQALAGRHGAGPRHRTGRSSSSSRLALAYLEFAAGPPPPMAGAVRASRWPRGDGTRRSGTGAIRSACSAMSSARLRSCSPTRAGRAAQLLARSLFSAVHGLVALGLEEKLQFIPLAALREQVTTIVERARPRPRRRRVTCAAMCAPQPGPMAGRRHRKIDTKSLPKRTAGEDVMSMGSAATAGAVDNVVARVERLPCSCGTSRRGSSSACATVLDAFDVLAIATVLPTPVPFGSSPARKSAS